MPSHQLESKAADTEIVGLDDLQQVDEVLLGVSGSPVQQLVVLAARELADLGDLITAVVEDRHRWHGVDNTSEPGECVRGERGLGSVIKIIESTELGVNGIAITGSLHE